jgi:hypothetical protein
MLAASRLMSYYASPRLSAEGRTLSMETRIDHFAATGLLCKVRTTPDR